MQLRQRAVMAGLVLAALHAQADDAALGREIFHDLCAACHGKNMVSAGLAFDLRLLPRDDYKRFQETVLNGKGSAMPPWRSQLSSEDIKALWDYVKSGG
jgi:mono/diheme cytochrome c family protein